MNLFIFYPEAHPTFAFSSKCNELWLKQHLPPASNTMGTHSSPLPLIQFIPSGRQQNNLPVVRG